jgi:hypothetical protein
MLEGGFDVAEFGQFIKRGNVQPIRSLITTRRSCNTGFSLLGSELSISGG